jgi:hypothetical protein
MHALHKKFLWINKTPTSGVQRQVGKITIKAAIYAHLSYESAKYFYLCKIVSIGKKTTSAAIRLMRADVNSMF